MPATAPVHAGMTWLLSLGSNRNFTCSLAGMWKSCNFVEQNQSDHGRSKRKGGTVKLGQIFISCLLSGQKSKKCDVCIKNQCKNKRFLKICLYFFECSPFLNTL